MPSPSLRSRTFFGMAHLNSNVLAAVTVDLTGLDPVKHELLEVCVLPLDQMLEPHPELIMFDMKMKPENPEEIDWGQCRMARKDVARTIITGVDRYKAADMFMDWFDRMHLNNRKKIIPLGHNYAKTQRVLIQWLGWDVYSEIFADDYRDVLIAAHFINDRDCVRAELPTFAKQNLRWLANYYHIPIVMHGGTCAADAMTIGQVYKRML